MEPLEIAHLLPSSVINRDPADDLIVLCRNCNWQIDSGQIRGYEFEKFVETLLLGSTSYSGIKRDVSLSNSKYRADIIASNSDSDLIIECKAVFGFVQKRFEDVIAQLDAYSKSEPSKQLVLATLSELTENQRSLLREKGYEHWGPSFFAKNFSAKLDEMADNFIAILIKINTAKNEAVKEGKSFSQQLLDCSPGKLEWAVYQRLIG
ncbi:hypothetical protein N9850_11895, partial [Granulosicoccus sp.]